MDKLIYGEALHQESLQVELQLTQAAYIQQQPQIFVPLDPGCPKPGGRLSAVWGVARTRSLRFYCSS